eukprot:scaffold100881_cov28-Tisochrysis_lutea.AAC.11
MSPLPPTQGGAHCPTPPSRGGRRAFCGAHAHSAAKATAAGQHQLLRSSVLKETGWEATTHSLATAL